jgi:hypothetical protein
MYRPKQSPVSKVFKHKIILIFFLAILVVFSVTILILLALGPVVGNMFSAMVMCDQHCTDRILARAWLDTNKNGIWDTDESPLAGVEFLIDGRSGEDHISDLNGEAVIDRFGLWSCDEACPDRGPVDISAKPPEGYEPTTSPIIKNVTMTYYPEPLPELQFGFVGK